MLAVIVATLTLDADLAPAQQRIEEVGTDTVMRDNKVFELEKGHLVILVDEKGVTMTDNLSNPLHMSLVDCAGFFEEFPDKTYKGNGYCINTDRDGDKLFNRWTASSDTTGGRYEVVGGTGKFERAKGEGTVTVTDLSQGPQARAVVQWKGSAEYPNLPK
jgi:hypothetical protein